MSENPYQAPNAPSEPTKQGISLSLSHILKETLSAFGCLGAAIAVVVAAMFVLSFLSYILFQAFGIQRE